jgi:hypothetical protein
MVETQTKHVEFTIENVTECQCGNCPVQEMSTCVSAQMAAMDVRATPTPRDTPKVHCSKGTTTCDDLDFSQSCICGTCAVWAENGLGNWKYCRNGSAETQG